MPSGLLRPCQTGLLGERTQIEGFGSPSASGKAVVFSNCLEGLLGRRAWLTLTRFGRTDSVSGITGPPW